MLSFAPSCSRLPVRAFLFAPSCSRLPVRAFLFAPSCSRLPVRAFLFALISGLACLLSCASACRANVIPWDANAQGQFITAFCLSSRGTVWIGTEEQGVWQYNPAAPAGKQYTHYTQQDGLGDNNAYALVCDKAGRVWAGTLNHGVSVFNGKEWRTYGPLDGPLGSRVFALAVNPKDGGVWGATEAGLFRYENSHWTYFTRADGLPSDQANALAFDTDGTLYVGTQCDGIAIASPADGYKFWRVVPGPAALPNAPSGTGLPSALINCLLVTTRGTVYAGTNCGLAASTDEGKTWQYRRGLDWKAKEAGLLPPVTPASMTVSGDMLSEDYVTALAEGADGSLFVGHRQTGVEAFSPKTGLRVQSGLNGAKTDSYVNALLLSGQKVWAGLYGGGVLPPDAAPATTSLVSSPPAAPLPVPAPPPTLAQLKTMLARTQQHKSSLAVGGGAYLGDDWQTEGDAIGHYGRQYAVLCAMNHVMTCMNRYTVQGIMGDHHAPGDGLRWWLTWLQTDTPRSLYTPVAGVRRQAEWDDHGEVYVQSAEGPDIWVFVHLGEGDKHRVSLYFMNKDGHQDDNRYRDYVIEVKPSRGTVAASDAAPTLAHARVHDFWDGVYKSFLLSSPGDYAIKISRNGSFNTILSGVFIDKVVGAQTVEDTEALAYMNGVHYDPPVTGEVPKTPVASAAAALWKSLDSYGDVQTQEADRLLAYRALASSGTAASLLADWRWSLGLWTPEDRAGFDAAMAHARAAGVKLAHARTPAEVAAASE